MTAYFDELDGRFVDGFDPGDTLIVDAVDARADGAFVVAHADDEVVAWWRGASRRRDR
ncbi:MAG: hypothetical protein R2697_13825 [Ilumatobacteraceae bacterium]